MQKRKNNLDKIRIGLLAGLILPLVIFMVVYLVRDEQMKFSDYLKGLWQVHALLKVSSLCVFANVAVFWGFLRLKYEKAARGVLGATILYALVVLISKAF